MALHVCRNQTVSCEIKFAHAHVRAHSHVCDVRAKGVFECVCDVRACGTFLGCAMCDRTFAHFHTFFVHFCDILRIFKVFS